MTPSKLPAIPEGGEPGLIIEHIMLSVTVVSTKDGAGQFDDSAAHVVARELMEYHGVKNVQSQVLYKHTKIEQHLDKCTCGYCATTGEN